MNLCYTNTQQNFSRLLMLPYDSGNTIIITTHLLSSSITKNNVKMTKNKERIVKRKRDSVHTLQRMKHDVCSRTRASPATLMPLDAPREARPARATFVNGCPLSAWYSSHRNHIGVRAPSSPVSPTQPSDRWFLVERIESEKGDRVEHTGRGSLMQSDYRRRTVSAPSNAF